MASRGLTITGGDAARAVLAIVAHAAAQREGAVSIGADEGTLVVASPGETSLLMARLDFEGDPEGAEGTYAPPDQPPSSSGCGGSLTLRSVRGRLQISAGKLRVELDRLSDEAVDVGWVWPATDPSVEAVVSRDGLLDALPAGEGRLSFSGADKQVVMQAGRDERRLPLKNRTRRRKDIGAAVAFDQLRPLVEAAAADVTLGLGDLRPLTVESGSVRGMLVRGAPMRWRATGAPPVAPREAPKPRRPRDDAKAQEHRRREAERLAREQAQEARRRARSATAAVAAVGRALSQVDAAADDAGQLGDEEARGRLEEARIALEAASEALRGHLDS
jgi:hypothetical protein